VTVKATPRYRVQWVGFVSGVLFALGLALSGMTDPGRVLAFLDVAGHWDPSLALVMGGAVFTHFLWLLLTDRKALVLPQTKGIERELVLGAAIFGVGWGMMGYCPGPALVAFAFARAEAIAFVVAMLCGMVAFNAFSASQRHASDRV
jgi:uncharacterized protein